jgi:enamine deaminase RidA (YjgF/YER057c/UK114 family)
MTAGLRVVEHQEPGRVPGLVFLAGDLVTDDYSASPKDAVGSDASRHGERLEAQAHLILEGLATALAAEGSDLDHVLTARVFLRDATDLSHLDRIWRNYLPSLPPRTVVGVGPRGLLAPGALLLIDLVAAEAVPDRTPRRVMPNTQAAGAAVCETECTVSGGWVFTGGKLATDATGDDIPASVRVDPTLPFHTSAIELQTEYILDRLGAALEAAGSDFGHVAKAQIFLRDLLDFYGFYRPWERRFSVPPPSTTVQMHRFAVADAACQIDLVATTRDELGPPRIVSARSGPKPLKHAQGSVVAGVAFPAGHVATDFANGVAPEARIDPNFPYYGSSIERQTAYVLDYLDRVLEASGSSLDAVVRAQIFMTDLHNFPGFDRVWSQRISPAVPRTTVEVAGAGLLTPGTLIEIDVVAASLT